MKFKISKSERKQYLGTNCLFAVFFHFTAHLLLLIAHLLLLIAHLLLLIAHFLGKMHPSSSSKISGPAGLRKTSRPMLVILQKNKIVGLAIFRKEKVLGWSCGKHMK